MIRFVSYEESARLHHSYGSYTLCTYGFYAVVCTGHWWHLPSHEGRVWRANATGSPARRRGSRAGAVLTTVRPRRFDATPLRGQIYADLTAASHTLRPPRADGFGRHVVLPRVGGGGMPK